MLIVAALGGNALLRRGEPLDAEVAAAQREARRVRRSPTIAREHRARRHARQRPADRAARAAERGVPRRAHLPARRARRGERGDDRLPARAGARQRARPSGTSRRCSRRPSSTRSIPRSATPTKPIGPVYDADAGADARRASGAGRSRPTATVGGAWSRRPTPRSIVELPTIELLLESRRRRRVRGRRRCPRRRRRRTARGTVSRPSSTRTAATRAPRRGTSAPICSCC